MSLESLLGVLGVALLAILSMAALHRWLRARVGMSYRKLAAALITKVYPALARDLRLGQRLENAQSVWRDFTMYTSRPDTVDEQRVWGYVDRHSIDPGESFDIMLSAGLIGPDTTGRVEIFRIGYEDAQDRRLVFTSEPIKVPVYSERRGGQSSRLLDKSAASVGLNWLPSVTVHETYEWSSGYYSVDFVREDSSRDREVAYLVVTDPKRTGDILIKLATATYQAYNRWGGHSLYDDDNDSTECRGRVVSFDRPTRSEFWEWEYYFVIWVEELAIKHGFSVAYASSFDASSDPSFISNYKLLISVGHDEYWSKQEFEWTYSRIFNEGGNTLFLGANLAYWQIRYADINALNDNKGRQLVCYKSLNDPIRARIPESDDPELYVTARFRDRARWPESMLMGVAYQSNFRDRNQTNPGYAYYVANANLPFFAGTGYSEGDYVAEIIGHEWDNRDPEAEYAPPGEQRVDANDRLWHERDSRIGPIPLDNLTVIFTGEPVDTFGRAGKAESVYFESPAGAKVLSAGTIRWSWGLSKAGYVQQQFRTLNRNLILALLDK